MLTCSRYSSTDCIVQGCQLNYSSQLVTGLPSKPDTKNQVQRLLLRRAVAKVTMNSRPRGSLQS